MPRPTDRAVPRALVVDDSADTAVSTGEVLAGYGFRVCVATTGREAVQLARAEPPDVILLDLSMPVMDGFAVAREICANLPPGAKRPLLVAVTGHGSDDDRARTKEAGFDLHLLKPVEPAVLVSLMRGFEWASD